jgi:hypothetical protein
MQSEAVDACPASQEAVFTAFQRAVAYTLPAQGLSQVVEAIEVECTPELITVILPPGKLRLLRPLALAPVRAVTSHRLLALRGQDRDSTILSGAVTLSGWAKLQDQAILTRLSASARGRVLVASLPKEVNASNAFQRRGFLHQGILAHPELYWRGARLPLARWPDDGFAQLADTTSSSPGWFSFASAVPPEIGPGTRLWATGYWSHDWADFHLPVTASEDPLPGFVVEDALPRYGLKAAGRVYLYNTLELLDRPGEWVLDHAKRLVYLWPPSDASLDEIEISTATTLLDLDGARGVSVSDLTLEATRGDAVSMRRVEDIRLSDCVVRNAGNRGVVLQGRNSVVERCAIENTGDAGLLLDGGDRATLESGGLSARANVITGTGAWTRTYAPAIEVRGVGNHVAGNLIRHLPHAAILLAGNDHVVELNRITDVAYETGDVGAIYMGRDWAARGNVIRGNLIERVTGVGRYGATGVYLDDFTSGTVVENNVLLDMHRGVLIGGGRENEIRGNLFADTDIPIHLDSRGETWAREMAGRRDSELWRRLLAVPYDREPYASRYPSLARLPDDRPELAKDNVVTGNVAVASTFRDSSIARAELQTIAENEDLRTDLAGRLPDLLRAGTAELEAVCASTLNLGWLCPLSAELPVGR